MDTRLEQLNFTISLHKKHVLKLFKTHTLISEGLCSCGAFKCSSQGKHPVYKDWKDGPFLDNVSQFVIRINEKNYLSNVAIKTGNGLIVLDFDSEESYQLFIQGYPQYKKTLTSKTGKGYHLYCYAKEKIGNKVRFLKDVDIRGDGGYVIAPGSNHTSGKDYFWVNPEEDLLEFPYEILNDVKKQKDNTETNLRTQVAEGGRNDFVFKETLKILELNVSNELITQLVTQLNLQNCNPPLDDSELETIINSAKNLTSKKQLEPEFSDNLMFGILGKLVNKISPETEAPPVAVYTQLITILGCYFGRVASSEVSGDKHYSNLMTLIVGDSALARKGTSLGVAVAILENVIPDFIKGNIKSGATSAEGIIYHNRDPIYEMKQKKGKMENVCIDAGITDKRCMIIETEFGSVLISMKREGNKLSTTIRDAYDSKNLSTLSKNNSVKSTNPHISLIAHITVEELRYLLNSVDVFNGFGNRFLITYIKSDKILPEAPSIRDLDLKDELRELSDAINFWHEAMKSPFGLRFNFSTEAQKLWNEVYTFFMKNPESGTIGTLLNRNLVHVKKMAIVFAMLDKKNFIGKDHLEAALAVGNYSKDSIRFIFRNSSSGLSNKHKKVLSLLEASQTHQVTRSEVSKDALKKNSSSQEIEEIKNDLISSDLITVKKTQDAEVWELKE